MAASASRPLRDDRPAQSSSSLSGSRPYPEPYYSNHDVEVLHEIVLLGETLLPSLPERARLPTNALFQAAEEILPEDTPPHIARFLFKLGGLRTDSSLYDKFEGLLAEMGINLAFDDSGSQNDQPVDHQSLPGTAADGPSQLATPSRPKPAVHREPIHPRGPGAQYALPFRIRPASTPPRTSNLQKSGTLHTVEELDDAEQLAEEADRPPTPQDSQGADDSSSQSSQPGYFPESDLGSDQLVQVPDDVSDLEAWEDLGEDRPVSNPTLPDLPQEPEPRPEKDRNGSEPLSWGEDAQPDAIQEQDNIAAPDSPRSREASVEIIEPPPNVPINTPSHAASNVPGDEEEELVPTPLRTPRTRARGGRQSLLLAVGLPLRPAPPTSSLSELEAKAALFQQYHDDEPVSTIVDMWRELTLDKESHEEEDNEFADECDFFESANTTLLHWLSRTSETRSTRVGTEDYHGWVEKNERLASRTYAVYATYNTVEYLLEIAKDEADRTAVARRHMLRKRLFAGWTRQHNEDQLKVFSFAANDAIQKWSAATSAVQVQSTAVDQRRDKKYYLDALGTMWRVTKTRTADCFYDFQAQESAVETWCTQRQELASDEEVAAYMEHRVPLFDAVTDWLLALRLLDSINMDGSEISNEAGHDSDLESVGMDLDTKLTHFLRQSDETARSNAVAALQQDAKRAITLRNNADSDFIDQPLEQWFLEARFASYMQRSNRRDLAETMHTMVLAERESWFLVENRQDDIYDAVNALHGAFLDSRRTAVQEHANANMVCNHYRQDDAVDSWHETLENDGELVRTAAKLDLRRTARPITALWKEKTRDQILYAVELETRAELRYEHIEQDKWASYWRRAAREQYTRRITEIYRAMRRREKRRQATTALSTWSHATNRRLTRGDVAWDYLQRDEVETAREGIWNWHMFAGNAQTLREGAELADREAYTDKWQIRMLDTVQNEQDAIDYDGEQICTHAIRSWERRILELDGAKHTVIKVRGRDDKRAMQDALGSWHHHAVPDAPAYRTSIAARRSVRQSMRQSVSASPSGSLAGLNSAFEDLEVESLDLSEVMASTPVRRSAMAPYRLGGPGGPSATTTPSMVLPSPAERELRRTYGERRVVFADIEEEEGEHSR